MARIEIVAIVADCDEVEPDETCKKCGDSLEEGAILALVRNGGYLNPVLLCSSCVAEYKMQF